MSGEGEQQGEAHVPSQEAAAAAVAAAAAASVAPAASEIVWVVKADVSAATCMEVDRQRASEPSLCLSGGTAEAAAASENGAVTAASAVPAPVPARCAAANMTKQQLDQLNLSKGNGAFGGKASAECLEELVHPGEFCIFI